MTELMMMMFWERFCLPRSPSQIFLALPPNSEFILISPISVAEFHVSFMSRRTQILKFHSMMFQLQHALNSRVISAFFHRSSQFTKRPVTSLAFARCFEREFVQFNPCERDLDGLYGPCACITHKKMKYPCALVSLFSTFEDYPCPDTGMWMVEPDFDQTGNRAMSILHNDSIESILRSAHLTGVSGSQFIPHHLTFNHTYPYYLRRQCRTKEMSWVTNRVTTV